jgi:hypothetical protein
MVLNAMEGGPAYKAGIQVCEQEALPSHQLFVCREMAHTVLFVMIIT